LNHKVFRKKRGKNLLRVHGLVIALGLLLNKKLDVFRHLKRKITGGKKNGQSFNF
jgi:hypothetical protein